MGRYYAQVGKYAAEYGDYQWDYLKYNRPLEYYEKFKFEIKITNLSSDSEADVVVKVPSIEFINLTKLRKNYTYSHKDSNTLMEYLFKYNRNLNEPIYCKPFINIGSNKTLYLDSKIDEDLVFKEFSDNIISLDNYSDIDKLAKKGIQYVDWCDENGNIYN